jgi:DNA-binding transcriptional LysR family regulator
MRLRHIEVFHAVYTCGSITAAAKMLNVSQPSVSKVLAHAEQQLGFALFDRQKGKIIPTQEAEKLIHHVTDVYNNINELRRTSENLRASDSGQIRFATIPSIGVQLAPSAIASYLAMYPETHFEVETLHLHQILRALKELRVDVGMAFDPPDTAGITIDHFATGEFVLLSHKSMDFGTKNRLSLEDLDGLDFIDLNTRSPLGRLLASHIESSQVKLHSVAKVETHSIAAALVANGAGVTIVDEFTARSMQGNNVTSWPLEPLLKFSVAMLSKEDEPLSIATQRFIDHLKTEVCNFLRPPIKT